MLVQTETPKQPFGETLKFYSDRPPDPANRTGLNVQYTVTRVEHPTLTIEIAPIPGANQAPIWAQKIALQLTKRELTQFCSVMFGLRQQMQASFHGQERNKGIRVYSNGASGVAIMLSEKGRTCQHLLAQDDRMELAVFAVRRRAQGWQVTVADAIALLRQAAWMERR